MKNILFSFKIIILIISMALISCSKEDDIVLDTRSFETNMNTDFFINRDGTVDISITGLFNDGDQGSNYVTRRGFVYGNSSAPLVGNKNTSIAVGPKEVTSTIKNLERDNTYFIRGFLEMNDGSFFYGNEIEASTRVDASTSRSIIMEMIEPKSIAIESRIINAAIRVIELAKASPIEIGLQYSRNSDLSDGITLLAFNLEGNIINTSYFVDVENLNPATTYYFRPYAKYADGSITNGGLSTIAISTKE